MSYQVLWSARAQKQLSRIDPPVQARILRATIALEENPRPHGCEVLKAQGGRMRIRVGDYRVLYVVEDIARIVSVVAVGSRGSVYQRR